MKHQYRKVFYLLLVAMLLGVISSFADGEETVETNAEPAEEISLQVEEVPVSVDNASASEEIQSVQADITIADVEVMPTLEETASVQVEKASEPEVAIQPEPEVTPAPVEATPEPVEITPEPEKTTPEVVEPTPAQVEMTSVSEENTPAPADITSAAVETALSPEESAPAPAEGTPAPVETNPSVGENTSPGEVTSETPEDTTPDTEKPTLSPEIFNIVDGVLTMYNEKNDNKLVSIPDGVRVIGKGAFAEDDILEIVILPDSVEEFQEKAFANCRNLKEIRISQNSGLRIIGSLAFHHCPKIDRSFAGDAEIVADNTFDEATEVTPTPAATSEIEVTPTPTPTDGAEATSTSTNETETTPAPSPTDEEGTAVTPAPTESVTDVPTAEPTENVTETPTAEPTSSPTLEPTKDPYEDIEWEDEGWYDDGGEEASSSASSGKGKKRQTHGKSKNVMTHDYEQVSLLIDADAVQQPMHILTLGGEELELILSDQENEERTFTISVAEKEFPPTDSEQETAAGTMLVLNAVIPDDDMDKNREPLCWQMNGSALLTLNKSDVDYLTFQYGEETITVPTDGFLAGWAYDAMKSRGIAERRFDFTLTMNPEAGECTWAVDVEGEHYDLETDPLSAMYLTGVEYQGGEDG